MKYIYNLTMNKIIMILLIILYVGSLASDRYTKDVRQLQESTYKTQSSLKEHTENITQMLNTRKEIAKQYANERELL